ncbi:MAG: hypothetical protein HFG44_08295 [Oscillospiraceae bacterium]|nr:hypothetical protein [Oscillospiraceae bacterium]
MSASNRKKLHQEQENVKTTQKLEREKQAKKEARKIKAMTIGFVAVVIVVVLAVAAGGFLNSGLLESHTTALTAGSHKLTPAEMKYFYTDYVNNFANNSSYSSMLNYIIDTSKPLDKQKYSDDQTWADYLMEGALNSAKDTYALYDEAQKNGYTLPEEQLQSIESSLNTVSQYASLYGYPNTGAYLKAIYGKGSSMDSYRNYLIINQTAASFANQHLTSLTYTDEDLRTKEAENFDAFSSYTFHAYNVATSNYLEAADSANPTDEEKAASREAAKKVADTIAANGTTEATFAKEVRNNCPENQAETYKEDDSTLQTNLLYSSLNDDIAQWLSDSSRKAGDTVVLPQGEEGAETSYNVILFVSSRDNSETPMVNVRHILIGTDDDTDAAAAKAKIEELKAQFEENPTEDNFATLANKNSTDTGSNTNGGLYENVNEGAMVAEFNEWIFDESRKAGDVGIVETEFGCHLIYFVEKCEQNYRDYLITTNLRNADYTAWHEALLEAYTTTSKFGMNFVDTGLILNPGQKS